MSEISAVVRDESGISLVYAEVGDRMVPMADLDGDGRYTGNCGSNMIPGDYNVTIVGVDRVGNAASVSCLGMRILDPKDLNGNKIEDSLETLGQKEERVIVLYNDNNSLNEMDQKGREIKVLPAKSMTIPGNSIMKLSNLDGIKGVYKDQKLKLLDSTSYSATSGLSYTYDNPFSIGNGINGSGVTVAMLDTGIDAKHHSLDDLDDDPSTNDPKVLSFVDFVNKQDEPYDDNGHGTHCASLIAGTMGIGVAPGAKLVSIKVMDREGACYLSDALTALDWCIENKDKYGIRIISMSVGGEDPSESSSLLDDACNRITEQGLVMVVAAGNSGPAPKSIVIPGSAEKVITVGAIDKSGKIFAKSSRGPTIDGRIKPDIVTLGVGIVSALAGTTDQESQMSGTSMAVPQVAGVAALLLQMKPDLSPADIKRILLKTANDLGEDGADYTYGYGAMNPTNAIDLVWNGSPVLEGPKLQDIDLSRTGGKSGDPVVIEATVSGDIDRVYSVVTGPDKELEIPMADLDKNEIYTGLWETGLWNPGDYKLNVYLLGKYGEVRSKTVSFHLDPK